MKKRPNLNREQRDIIADLVENHGWTHARIARHLGCSEGSVAWAILAMGVEKPGPVRPPKPTPVQRPVCRRGAGWVIGYNIEDDELLLALEAQGLSPVAIGRQMVPRRRPNSITGRLRTLARREARFEAILQRDGAVQTRAML